MSLTEQTQTPDIVEQAGETHDKKSAEQSFAELRMAKEELERKNALLRQQEKERNDKHTVVINRLQKFAEINFSILYDKVAELTDESFNVLYAEKKSEYEAEQNRLFVEKKKKERDEAFAKAEAEQKAKAEREAALAPDKDKLKTWLNSNLMPCFGGSISEEGHEIANEIFTRFQGFNKWANEQIEKLK